MKGRKYAIKFNTISSTISLLNTRTKKVRLLPISQIINRYDTFISSLPNYVHREINLCMREGV